MSEKMTKKMVRSAIILQNEANNYRKLYEAEMGKVPVIWIRNDETGNGIFIADSYSTYNYIEELKE